MEGLNLSPVGLFLEAGLVGKFVMAVLFGILWVLYRGQRK